MPLWDFLLNRFGTSVTPVGASTTYYGSHPSLSRGWDKTDILIESRFLLRLSLVWELEPGSATTQGKSRDQNSVISRYRFTHRHEEHVGPPHRLW